MKSKYQIYKISGQSLEGDNIYNNDFVIVDPKAEIVNDDLVILEPHREAVLIKHFYKKGKHKMFYPFVKGGTKEASAPLDDAKMKGKVVAIIKKEKKTK